MKTCGTLTILICLFLALSCLQTSAAESKKLAAPEVEVEIGDSPPRILSYKPKGAPSLLFHDPVGLRSGIRFVALEEKEGKLTLYAFDEQGVWLAWRETGATLRLPSEAGKVELELDISLQEGGNRMAVNAKLKNLSDQRRGLALWAICSVPMQGWLAATMSNGIERSRWVHGRVTGFWASPFDSPGLKFGKEGFALDLGKEMGKNSVKYGTRSNAGWMAAIRPDLQCMLIGHTTYSSDDKFPDEDCNVEAWVGGTPQGSPYAEIEWLSPWSSLAPEAVLDWKITFESKPFESSEAITTDTIVQSVRAPTVVDDSSPSETKPAWRLDARGAVQVDTFQHVTLAWQPGEAKTQDPIAKAPLWFNAPVRSADGASLIWTEDTIFEAAPKLLPKWSKAGRKWMVEFAALPGDKERRILFQDGSLDSAMSVYLFGNKATAVLWKKQGETFPACEASTPITSEEQKLEIEYLSSERKLSIAAAGREPVTADVPFESISPGKRLVLGRDGRWPDTLKPEKIKAFSGKLLHLEITR